MLEWYDLVSCHRQIDVSLTDQANRHLSGDITSKNPTPEGPALETPVRGYLTLPPEGARIELPLSC
jgi:hypothetical protein